MTHCHWCGALGARKVRIANYELAGWTVDAMGYGSMPPPKRSHDEEHQRVTAHVCPDCEDSGVLEPDRDERADLNFEAVA